MQSRSAFGRDTEIIFGGNMTCIEDKMRLPIRMGVSHNVLHVNLCSAFGNNVWEPDVDVLGHVWEVVSSVLGIKLTGDR